MERANRRTLSKEFWIDNTEINLLTNTYNGKSEEVAILLSPYYLSRDITEVNDTCSPESSSVVISHHI